MESKRKKRKNFLSVFGAKNCSVCFFIGIESEGHLTQHNSLLMHAITFQWKTKHS